LAPSEEFVLGPDVPIKVTEPVTEIVFPLILMP
jgi:hypothetical protein